MTLDTIFDAASLTKVIATTSCLMKLFEQGKLRLNDPVTEYLPEFQGGHSPITDPQPDDAFLGLAAGPGPAAALERIRNRHPEGADRQAAGPPRSALRLQRYQFHPAGRDRAPVERENSR